MGILAPSTQWVLAAFGSYFMMIIATSSTSPLFSFTHQAFAEVSHLKKKKKKNCDHPQAKYFHSTNQKKKLPNWQKLMTYVFGLGGFPPIPYCLFAKQRHRRIYSNQLGKSTPKLVALTLNRACVIVQRLSLLCLLLFFTDVGSGVSVCFFRNHFSQISRLFFFFLMAAVSTWEDEEIGLNRSIYRRLKKTKESSVCYHCLSEAWAFRLPLLASVCIWHSVIQWLKQDRLFCLSVESPKLVWQLGCTPRDPDSCWSTIQGVALVLMTQVGSPWVCITVTVGRRASPAHRVICSHTWL